MKNSIELHYGALAEKLEIQLNKQEYTLGRKAELMEKIQFAINILYVHGYISDSQKSKMLQKLHKNVMGNLKALPTKENEESKDEK